MFTASKQLLEAAWRGHWTPRATRYEPCSIESSVALQGEGADRIAGVSRAEPPMGDTDPAFFALLLDISASGAAIVLDHAPHPRNLIWLRLRRDGEAARTAAEMVDVTSSRQGPHLARLAFLDPCPVEMLLETVCRPI